MSTQPDASQTSPSAPDSDFDELTGVYGFFRRHQKKLLYTAGLFTLLTFSITGPMTQLAQSLFSELPETASIEVGGTRVDLTAEDYRYGNLLSRNYQAGLPQGVMVPFLQSNNGGDSDLGRVLAILRRAAVQSGIEPSMIEVERAIAAARGQQGVESTTALARARGFATATDLERLVAEGMRIGMFVRLNLLSLDAGDAEVMRQLLLYKEKAGFRVAVFDEAERQEELAAATEMSREDLESWLDEQPEIEKRRMRAYDVPKVALKIGALLLAEGQFDPAEWNETSLKDYTLSSSELQAAYDQERDVRFQDGDTDADYREFDDEGVQDELTRLLQAQKVMVDLNTALRDAQLEVVRPMIEAVNEARGEQAATQAKVDAATEARAAAEAALAAAKKQLEAAPEDAQRKAEVARLEGELKTAADEAVTYEEELVSKRKATDDAVAAQEAARVSFDFEGELKKLVEGKSGFVFHAPEGLHTAAEFEDLDALGLDLGTWSRSAMATSLREPGTLANGPGRTTKAVILYQATETDPQPLKPWDDLEKLVRDSYWTKQASDEGKQKFEVMEAALLRLAKEKIPEFVTEHEGQLDERLKKRADEWRSELQAGITEADEMLARPNLGTKAKDAWSSKRTRLADELAGEDEVLVRLREEVEAEIADEVGEEARKHYGDVLAAAAEEAGFVLETLEPLPRSLASRPRCEDIYGKTASYVFTNHSDLEEGDAVGPVTERASRRHYVVVCDSVVPMTADDVTRREFEQLKAAIERSVLFNGLSQAFTIDALTGRYGLQEDVGRQVEPGAQ